MLNKLEASIEVSLDSEFGMWEWASNVRGEGIWDLKANKETIWGIAWDRDLKAGDGRYTMFSSPYYLFEDASDFGNYHAGITGTNTGVPTSLQKIGAGLFEQMKDLDNGDFIQVIEQYESMGDGFWPWNWGSVPNTFMDEKDDFFFNTSGMADAIFIMEKFGLEKGKPNSIMIKPNPKRLD